MIVYYIMDYIIITIMFIVCTTKSLNNNNNINSTPPLNVLNVFVLNMQIISSVIIPSIALLDLLGASQKERTDELCQSPLVLLNLLTICLYHAQTKCVSLRCDLGILCALSQVQPMLIDYTKLNQIKYQ